VRPNARSAAGREVLPAACGGPASAFYFSRAPLLKSRDPDHLGQCRQGGEQATALVFQATWRMSERRPRDPPRSG